MWDGGFAGGEGNGLRWGGTSPAGGVLALVGEEARSRETGENAEVSARHLVPLRAALRVGDPVRTGCNDRVFHGPSAFGSLALSIPYGDNINH